MENILTTHIVDHKGSWFEYYLLGNVTVWILDSRTECNLYDNHYLVNKISNSAEETEWDYVESLTTPRKFFLKKEVQYF